MKMRSLLTLALCLGFVILFAQTVEEFNTKFAALFTVAVGIIYVVAQLLATKIKWLANNTNAKLVSALVAAAIALVGAIITKLPPLTFATALGIILPLVDLVKGWIDGKNGETIAAKAKRVAAFKALKQ